MRYLPLRRQIIIDSTIKIVIDNKNRVIVGSGSIKEGDDFRIFYINNKDKCTFERGDYYTKTYTPEEKLQHIMSPLVDKLIKTFDLEH